MYLSHNLIFLFQKKFRKDDLEKYEYLTGKDLRYKPGIVGKAKFEYSLLDNVFNKELDEKDKKEGLLKRLKNIEGKNE